MVTGRSEASARKYDGALRNKLSKLAKAENITQQRLDLIDTLISFKEIANKLKTNPLFQSDDLKGNAMYSNALDRFAEYLARVQVADLTSDITAIVLDESSTETEKTAQIKQRIGQGEYRENLIKLWGGCAVTGYSQPWLLIASHIKPWKNSNEAERLNKFNGLLLVPNLDKVFDQGYISFNNEGKILISSDFERYEEIGIKRDMSIQLFKENRPFLEFHRQEVFRK